MMIRILLLLFLSVQFAAAQNPVTRDQMRLPDRVSKDQLEAGYQSANGWVVHKGDSLLLGKGSMPDKRFAFVYESLTSFTSPNSPGTRNYLSSNMSGQRVLVKELFQYGTKRTGYTMIAKVGVGSIVNYWIEIDNAVEAGELSPPTKFIRTVASPTTSGNSSSVADELKKWKDLLDAGAITKEEYDSQKRKLLSQP